MSAHTTDFREGTGQTYRRSLSCGAVSPELPTPATFCKHTGQMYLDLLHVCRCRRLDAAKTLTYVARSSACTRTEHSTRKVPWTNSTSREQRAGDFDGSRFTPSVYEAAAKQLLPSLSLHTLPRRHSARGRYLGQASPRDKNAQAFWMSVAHKEHQKVLCTRPTTKFCATLFADLDHA